MDRKTMLLLLLLAVFYGAVGGVGEWLKSRHNREVVDGLNACEQQLEAAKVQLDDVADAWDRCVSELMSCGRGE